MNHLYGNGHNITIGDNVSCSGLYLYGASKDGTLTVKPGIIQVRSGSIARIIGYIRSNGSVDANNNEAVIIVDGTAKVDTIVAGSASGEIKNGNVGIYIRGGTVNKIIGGCQGFSNVKAPYTGKTSINISGGTVNMVYGAGSGRATGIPTYQGRKYFKHLWLRLCCIRSKRRRCNKGKYIRVSGNRRQYIRRGRRRGGGS